MSVRETIVEKLKQCEELKLLHDPGGREFCRRLAEEAYSLAQRQVVGSETWREIAAYRLAHLVMRTDEDINRAINLFVEADGSDEHPGVMSPRGLIYAAALALRAAAINLDLAGDKAESLIDRAKQRMRSGIRKRGFADQSSFRSQKVLNECALNMLEVAAFASGYPTADIEGLAALPDVLAAGGRAWKVVSNVPDWGDILVTERFAKLELKRIANANLNSVTYTSGPTCVLRCGESAVPLGAYQPEILTCVLATGGVSRSLLRQRVGLHDRDDLFRQHLSGLKQKLRLLAPNVDEPLVTEVERMRISPQIPVYAAIKATSEENS